MTHKRKQNNEGHEEEGHRKRTREADTLAIPTCGKAKQDRQTERRSDRKRKWNGEKDRVESENEEEEKKILKAKEREE